MSCRRRKPLSGRPPYLTGRRPTDELELRMARSLTERCQLLWTALLGSGCDFDDLFCTLAERLGWAGSQPGEGFFDVLNAAYTTIDECGLSWAQLRELAVGVFDTQRGMMVVETTEYDPRDWEQLVSDVLFESGRCRACALGVSGTPAEHRELAGWVLHRRVTWDQIADVVQRHNP